MRVIQHGRLARYSPDIGFPPEHMASLHFPASLAGSCGHMTEFWPVSCWGTYSVLPIGSLPCLAPSTVSFSHVLKKAELKLEGT